MERLELDAGIGVESPRAEDTDIKTDTDTDTPPLGSSAAAAGAAAPSTTSAANPVSSGMSAAPAKPSSAGAGAAGSTGSSPGTPPTADSCSKRNQIEGCDPTANTGCIAELGMQCDVDLLAGALTGMCVWSSPPPDPSSCLAIFPTQSCPAQSTCVEGKCLKICLCDSDCGAAERCAMPLGASSFKACQAR